MSSLYEIWPLTAEQRASFGVDRIKMLAFEAVHKLWARRKAEGRTQSQLAATLGRDEGWLSRNLRGPGNWTMKTFGEMIEALDGDVEIVVRGIEDPRVDRSNDHAYAGYDDYRSYNADDIFKGGSASDPPIEIFQ